MHKLCLPCINKCMEQRCITCKQRTLTSCRKSTCKCRRVGLLVWLCIMLSWFPLAKISKAGYCCFWLLTSQVWVNPMVVMMGWREIELVVFIKCCFARTNVGSIVKWYPIEQRLSFTMWSKANGRRTPYLISISFRNISQHFASDELDFQFWRATVLYKKMHIWGGPISSPESPPTLFWSRFTGKTT